MNACYVISFLTVQIQEFIHSHVGVLYSRQERFQKCDKIRLVWGKAGCEEASDLLFPSMSRLNNSDLQQGKGNSLK